jgi:hypothetical protein
MNEKHHAGKFRFHIPLLCMLLFLALVSSSQKTNPDDSMVFIPSIDSMATTEPADKEAGFEGEDEAQADTVSGEVQKEVKAKDKFIEIASPGWRLDTFPQRKADTRLFKNDDEFWYANATFAKKKTQSKGSQSSTFYQTFLWLLAVGGFIAFLIIYLSNSNISLFRRSKTMEHLEGEHGIEDIFAINYNREIEKAIAAGDYRIAVRLLFLQLLRGMSDRNIIQYSHERTNLDYLLQVHHAPWYKQFFRITRNYEYVWYGLFEIDRPKFEAINKDFKNLELQLPSI